jgi:predicted nucleic acid-binding protein
MKPVFADTAHFIAALNAQDRWHARAVALSRNPPAPLVTTEWVLLEVGDAFSFRQGRMRFVRLLELLRQQPDVEIVPATTEVFRRAVDLYANRPDKDWSLTDCTSFVVMQTRHLQDALTADHHFEQAGFRILLKD